MALTSSSTYADAVAQYNDNLLWDGDVTKAKAALESVRWIIINRHKITKTDHREVEFEINAMMDEKKRIETYLDGADTTSRPRSSFVRGVMNYD